MSSNDPPAPTLGAQLPGGTYCAFCTAEFPDEAPDTVGQIQRHVYQCPYHPMREVERDRDAMDSQATRYRVALEQAQRTLDAQAARLAAVEAERDNAEERVENLRRWRWRRGDAGAPGGVVFC